MISKKIAELLKDKEFISVATCDFRGKPNVAPKFILKLEGSYLYLVDYVLGTTFSNLTINPRVSISLMDLDALLGYQINGAVEIITKGAEFEKMMNELKDKEMDLSIKRIIEGIDSGKKHAGFEVTLSENAAILKVKIEETVEISSRGILKREKI
jgi:predicted pyridoxine 5'-phosphate oxidase superfamily flavin-nucleotide-binding protein